jgi:hypothetical protein
MDGHLRIRWRWVWYVVGVLIAGCNSAVPTLRNPATFPTLPGYTFIPPTFTPFPRLLRTPVRVATLGGSASGLPLSTPHPLALDPPLCSETPVGSLWCSGLIRNTLSYQIEGVSVRLYLVDTQGEPLLWRDVPMARLTLWAGDESPYGALFEAVPETYSGVVAELHSAKAAQKRKDIFLLRAVVNATAPPPASDATVTVSNTGTQTAPESQVILILLNSKGQVIGYRTALLGKPLAPGESAPVSITTGAVAGIPFTMRASAEALPKR